MKGKVKMTKIANVKKDGIVRNNNTTVLAQFLVNLAKAEGVDLNLHQVRRRVLHDARNAGYGGVSPMIQQWIRDGDTRQIKSKRAPTTVSPLDVKA